ADETRHVGTGAGLGVVEGARRAAFVESNAPAVAVRAGLAAAPNQSGKRKANVGRDIRAHSEKFTHGWNRRTKGSGFGIEIKPRARKPFLSLRGEKRCFYAYGVWSSGSASCFRLARQMPVL